MIQGGIYKAILIEAKNLSINYDTFSISGGVEIELKEPTLNIEQDLNIIKYSINAEVINFDEIINNSIYGWIAKIYFYDKTIKIVDQPFFGMQNSDFNTNISHSRKVNISTWSKRELIAFN